MSTKSVSPRRISLVPAFSSIFLLGFLLLATAVVFAIPQVNAAHDWFEADINILHGEIWRLVTYVFLHNSLEHIVSNSLSIAFFGWVVTRSYSDRDWLLVYFLSAMFTALVVLVLMPWERLTGASQSAFALAGMSVAACFRCRAQGWESPTFLSGWFWGALALLCLAPSLIGPPGGLLAHAVGLLFGVGCGFILNLNPLAEQKERSRAMSDIETAVDAVISANPDKVEQTRAKPANLGWFVGQVMKRLDGNADPAAVAALLKEKIGLG